MKLVHCVLAGWEVPSANLRDTKHGKQHRHQAFDEQVAGFELVEV